MRKEIRTPLSLSDRESARIQMHSFVNVVNVIIGVLELLRNKLNDPDIFGTGIASSYDLLYSFNDTNLALEKASQIAGYKTIILEEIAAARLQHADNPAFIDAIDRYQDNLNGVFEVVDVRVREILARVSAPDKWISHSTAMLLHNIHQVLDAIKMNSRSTFDIVYDPLKHTSGSYLVTLDIHGDTNGHIRMPSIVQDCFRDLVANARKYTPVGGIINGSLIHTGSRLEIKVSDTGRGIPEQEIEHVVEYGVRGSNTTPVETKGEGFGLTKAYLVSRQFGGSMFIDSALDKGTTIEIIIPDRLSK